ncbi:hypothetical protein SUGI_0042110 [Cryptomeria japonica]|nr:hypothetical protein SUGI_0042110 [Cryptomeria japonica]
MKITSLTSLLIIGLCISCTLSNPDGFLSINCGVSKNWTDVVGIDWVTDSSFVKTRNASSMPSLGSTDWAYQYQSVAYFTNLHVNKYCYLIPVTSGTLYLVRLRFSYGGFEGLRLASVFDVFVEGIKMTKIDLRNLPKHSFRYREIILAAKSNSLSLCLARNSETEDDRYVFISTLELRPLEYPMYNLTDFNNAALVMLSRRDYGSYNDSNYPNDPFDRIWRTFMLSSTTIIRQDSSLGDGLWNKPPVSVLQTAITSKVGEDLIISDQLESALDNVSCYFALYFCNVNKTSHSSRRSFQVFISDVPVTELLEFTSYGQCIAIYRMLYFPTINFMNIKLSPGKGSDMGPFINAAEAYQRVDNNNMTHAEDVLAIRKIANTLNVPDDWTVGDPCLPADYPLTGILCNEDNPPRVIIVNLTNMGLAGNIPSSLANLSALTQLLLGNNNLIGSVPDLSPLKNLKILQLQNNQLTGDIPSSLEKLTLLKELFLQNNKLNGAVPPGLIKSGLNFRFSPQSNNISPQSSFHLAPQSNVPGGSKNDTAKRWILGLSTGCPVLLIAVISIILWRYKHRQRSRITNGPIMQLQHSCSDEDGPNEYHKLAIEFTEEDIKVATNNYSTVIGKGGFGSVFYGKLSGYDVAVKILSSDSNQGKQEFRNEVTLLSRIYHKNLVNLVGYCRQSIVALVYEYMHGGTLKDHLYGRAKLEKPLDWQTRLNISLQAAQGLLYLHQGCSPPIIHRDIKCTNILLDRKMNAKVADFGLSKLLEDSKGYTTTNVMGTIGYVDPEYFGTRMLNEKSDVYSFGVVLLEIISGISPKDGVVQLAKNLISCGRLQDLMDTSLDGLYSLTSAWKVAEIAFNCVEQTPTNRPKMSTVVKELEEAVGLVSEDGNQLEHARSKILNSSELPEPR